MDPSFQGINQRFVYHLKIMPLKLNTKKKSSKRRNKRLQSYDQW